MLYTQEEFLSRLQRYRQLGASYDSAVDYFDELEIHPEYVGTVFKVTVFIQAKKGNQEGGGVFIICKTSLCLLLL